MFASNLLVVLLALLASNCSFSTKALYFDKEIAVAERASLRFHELRNEQNFNAIFELLDKQGQPNAPAVLSELRANYDKYGQSLESTLVEKKVIPSPAHGYTSQVKLAYETRFEKGNWTELFAWNIRNSTDAVLVDYVVVENKAPTPSGSPNVNK